MLIFCKPYDDFWVVCRKAGASIPIYLLEGFLGELEKFFSKLR